MKKILGVLSNLQINNKLSQIRCINQNVISHGVRIFVIQILIIFNLKIKIKNHFTLDKDLALKPMMFSWSNMFLQGNWALEASLF
jgi:hypothetical protein